MSPADVRSFALSLPETEERETWGEATFRVRNKIFVTLSDEPAQAGVKASLEDQEALLAMDPETFAPSHYTGRFGWVTVRLATVEPDLMRELVVGAWKRTATKRMVQAYEAAH